MTERIMTETERELLSSHLAGGILDHAEECESQPEGMKTWGIGGPALTLGTPATPDTEGDADQAGDCPF